jgi:DNA-binding NarL/FixJ family response regulator
LLESIGQVAAGGAVLPPRLAARLFSEFARQAQVENAPGDAGVTPENVAARLTARQHEILMLVSQGMTYPQIGSALSLSEPTVRYHMGQIMDHLHLENRSQVIAYAARHGLGKGKAE